MNQPTDKNINNISPSEEEQKSRFYTLWLDIVESVKGTERDYTEGSISKAILLLSIPFESKLPTT